MLFQFVDEVSASFSRFYAGANDPDFKVKGDYSIPLLFPNQVANFFSPFAALFRSGLFHEFVEVLRALLTGARTAIDVMGDHIGIRSVLLCGC